MKSIHHINFPLLAILLLSGCWGEKSNFIDACMEDGVESEVYCSCTYDLAKETLDPKLFEFVVEAMVADEEEKIKLKAKYGPMQMLAMMPALSRYDDADKKLCRSK